MKKTLAVVLTMGLALSFVGCGDKAAEVTEAPVEAASVVEEAATVAESVAEEVVEEAAQEVEEAAEEVAEEAAGQRK
jgi:vacuolar-type H+-ATPase subunit H